MCQKLTFYVLYLIFICVCLCFHNVVSLGEVLWAVNCGGEAHIDVHGVHYQKDFLQSGTPSEYGRSMTINRVHHQDQILYQTERYDSDTFGYDIPVKKDGDYVLVLKFSEVWFSQPNQKVYIVATFTEQL